MEGEGPDTTLPVGKQNPTTARTNPRGKSRTLMTRASDVLEDMTRIGIQYDNVPKNRRYADLNRNEIFRYLVDLYEVVFKAHWNYFDKMVTLRNNDAQYANNNERYAAAVYISSWFHDLYMSNRLAVKKLSDAAYVEHYYIDEVFKSEKYDGYLATLNAHIRPTIIKYTHEETLFVPRIAEVLHPDAVDDDYFDIERYTINDHLLKNITYTLEDRKIFRMEELSENTLGRPSWLFDWQTDGLAYAWFPEEGNYNMEDVATAYIVGTACTPLLGPRDKDEWRLLPGNVDHQHPERLNLQRLSPINYHGHIEFRTYKKRTYRLDEDHMAQLHISARQIGTSTATPGAKTNLAKQSRVPLQITEGTKRTSKRFKGKNTTSQSQAQSTQDEAEEGEEETATSQIETNVDPETLTSQVSSTIYEVEVPVFRQVRIIDYIYHARIIYRVDMKSRVAAHRTVIYPQK